MISTRGKFLRSLLKVAGTASLFVATVAPSLWAQNYGPDPFKPYNNQYLPYTYPMGPTAPGAGQGGGALARMGNGGANQFQDYLDDVSGSGRAGTNIGTPYYRSSIDPRFDPNGSREYRPNRLADQSFEKGQEVITKKYLAYFAEKDPKKRAELLRDYNRIRTKVSRAMSVRRESASRILDAAVGRGTEGRRSASADHNADDSSGSANRRPRSSSRTSPRRSSAEPAARSGSASIPPAPPLFGGDSARRATPHRNPSDVLERSRGLNSRTDDSKPDASSTDAAGAGAASQPVAPSPPSE